MVKIMSDNSSILTDISFDQLETDELTVEEFEQSLDFELMTIIDEPYAREVNF